MVQTLHDISISIFSFSILILAITGAATVVFKTGREKLFMMIAVLLSVSIFWELFVGNATVDEGYCGSLCQTLASVYQAETPTDVISATVITDIPDILSSTAAHVILMDEDKFRHLVSTYSPGPIE